LGAFKVTVYCGIAADINNNLETFYYIKIGYTGNCAITRCDAQRVKHIWNINSIEPKKSISLIPTTAKFIISNPEKTILEFASKQIDFTKFDYSPAGHSESLGNYKTAKEAMLGALNLLEALNEEYNIDYAFHPLAIPYLEAA
jgi:hypothetical protein